MNKIITIIKNKKILILLIISIFSSILILTLTNKKGKEIVNTTPQKEINVQIAKYKEISAGEIYNEEKINSLLGSPTQSTINGEIKINNYRSSNEYRTNEMRIKNGEIDFIKEVVNPGDNKNYNTINNIYGTADTILYEKASDSYFSLYAYLAKGIAYLGHSDGTIIEIWYFKPTDIDSFIEKYAQNYQKTPFTEQTGY